MRVASAGRHHLHQPRAIGRFQPRAHGVQRADHDRCAPVEAAYAVGLRGGEPQSAQRIALVREDDHARALRAVRQAPRRCLVLFEPYVRPDRFVAVVERVTARQRDRPADMHRMAFGFGVGRRRLRARRGRAARQQQHAQRAGAAGQGRHIKRFADHGQ
ncbi:TPA: hypothetical protein QDC20_002064 [Burkholderia aenigmatica]|uniref:hypothetical protein n=1 Tax=Burkholderia sp. AU45251 TaxID=3059204 RepID=UPI00264BC5D9|nr:hypothetical protein [Burkholderia sp. AU45251]HDR9483937.1 hypothetical protein [Burkholderia aenigmatica]MDN7516196.1 hypothetical protein [Burkholderia sp. AU45251]HDR9514902.1 hypothetical protein [Burkholderia aenigmatica]HDR9591987.1 hypothetical protein [Burkholderia aenigmatica]HDR9601237.1 hypothetical protein [Burkholderia aenigmatica]